MSILKVIFLAMAIFFTSLTLIKTCWGFSELAKFIGIDERTLDRRMQEINELEYS